MVRSLYSGVSGLNSHQTKMDVIGNNIANVNTYGYKTSRVTFRDIYYQSMKNASAGDNIKGGINPSQVGFGVSVASIDKIMSRSSFQQTGRALDVAIAGEGFIQLKDKAGNKFYTRAGNLLVDNFGNVTDAMGKFVLGVSNGDPKNLDGLSPNAGTSNITVMVPDVGIAKPDPDNLLTATAGDGEVDITLAFLNGDIPGDVTLSFESDEETKEDTALIEYDGTTVTVTITLGTKPPNVPMENIANSDTLLARVNAAIQEAKNESGVNIGPLSINVTDFPANMTAAQIKEAKNNVVQSILVGQDLIAEDKEQSFSDLSSFYVSEEGVLVGIHAVHGMLAFGRIDLACFDNPEGLEGVGNSYFAASTASGDAKRARPGFDGSGSFVSNALEMSNVNLAQEFSDMITTQRGFQANSRIITTSDEMLQELVNLKR